jgi:hypothetical protein
MKTQKINYQEKFNQAMMSLTLLMYHVVKEAERTAQGHNDYTNTLNRSLVRTERFIRKQRKYVKKVMTDGQK